MQKDARHALARRHPQQFENLLFMGMHAARGQEPQHMQGSARARNPGEQGVQRRVPFEFAPFDGPIDAAQILQDHPARTEVHVPDFGVAHLPGRQAHIRTRCGYERMRPGGQEAVPIGCVGRGDRIVVDGDAVTESVQYDKQRGHSGVPIFQSSEVSGRSRPPPPHEPGRHRSGRTQGSAYSNLTCLPDGSPAAKTRRAPSAGQPCIIGVGPAEIGRPSRTGRSAREGNR